MAPVRDGEASAELPSYAGVISFSFSCAVELSVFAAASVLLEGLEELSFSFELLDFMR